MADSSAVVFQSGYVPPAPEAPAPEPVEPLAPVDGAPVGEEPAPETPPAEEPPETDEDGLVLPPTNRGQRRFVANLLKKTAQYESKMAQLEAQNQILIQRLAAPEAPTPPASPATPAPPPAAPAASEHAPRVEDYERHEDWVRAIGRWEARQEFQAQRQAEEQRQAQARQAQVERTVRQRIAEGQRQFADWDTAFQTVALRVDGVVNAVVQEVTAEHERGAALLYHLGTHPDTIEALQDYTPQGMRNYLRRLADGLTPRPAAPAPPARTPAPPAPPTPVSGNGSSAPVTGFRPGMSYQEYERYEQARMRGQS